MKKRVFSLLLIVYILILNVVPVFGLDEFVVDNFQNMEIYDNYIENLNDNIDSYVYTYYVKVSNNDSSFPGIFIYTDYPFELYLSNANDNVLDIYNPNSEEIEFLVSHFASTWYYKKIPANGWLYYNFGYKVVDFQLLIQDSNCVSETYCSPDVYFSGESGDYEEDGVVIKGLTSFFNNIISSINGMVDNLIIELKKLIGLPPDGYFNSKFEEIKINLDNKYNFSSVFEIFNRLKSIQAQKPVFDKTFNFSFDDINIPFHFKIDFDFIDSIRDYLFAFIRAFGYFYLIIYNMNQYYLLFRGQRFFYDMRDSYSYTDSNGKEHSHERGEKKWY